MKVTLNGKQTEIEVKTVLDLLQSRKVEPQMVAVELNEKMLERDDFSKTPLHEGDRIELHHFMGGGASPFITLPI
jgi:sulfur carrier protein